MKAFNPTLHSFASSIIKEEPTSFASRQKGDGEGLSLTPEELNALLLKLSNK